MNQAKTARSDWHHAWAGPYPVSSWSRSPRRAAWSCRRFWRSWCNSRRSFWTRVASRWTLRRSPRAMRVRSRWERHCGDDRSNGKHRASPAGTSLARIGLRGGIKRNAVTASGCSCIAPAGQLVVDNW